MKDENCLNDLEDYLKNGNKDFNLEILEVIFNLIY